MTSVAVRLTLAFAAAAPLACSSDHDLLAEKPTPGSDGGTSDGAGVDDSFPVNPHDVRMPVDAVDPEPPGPWALTLVNGVVDVGNVRFCFVPVLDGGESPTEAPPLPPAPGLSFGDSVVLTNAFTSLQADARTTDVHPYLVVGADGANAPLSCRQILRGMEDGGTDASTPVPPDGGRLPSAYSLPLVPAGTLAESRSYLAIANGCAMPARTPEAGAPADAGDAEAGDVDAGPSLAACGTGFGPTTLGLSLVRLSRRVDYSRVGFQTVNGSNAAAPAMLLMENWTTNVTIYASDGLDLGQISPHAQPGYVSRDDFGVPVKSALLSVVPPVGATPFPEFDDNLGVVLAASHLEESDLTEGSLFTFVLLGAQPKQTDDPRAAPYRIVLVPSAPSTASDAD
jgi:hypothetical protein